MDKINLAIIGAASLTAEFLIKILQQHNLVKLNTLVSNTNKGKYAAEIYPFLKNCKIKFTDFKAEKLVKENEVIFCCQRHGEGLKQTYELIKLISKEKLKVKIIDLSADFRLKNFKEYKKWYGFNHPYKEQLKYWVYGLPEIYKDKIKKNNLVANPGCYATSIILAVAPLVKNNLLENNYFSATAISGVSGAGRTYSEKNLALNILENIIPYKVNTHQHTPEILQTIQEISNFQFLISNFNFIPMVAGFKYGIIASINFNLSKQLSWKNIYEIYKNFYRDSPFVRIYAEGKFPQISDVVGTNFCDIGFNISTFKSAITIISALDNLYKGAAAQAVQNMNLMCGFEETTAL